MSHLIIFVMACAAVLLGNWFEGDGITNPIAVAGCTLLAHWVFTR